MTTYVFRGGRFVDKQTGEPMALPPGNDVPLPMINSDISGFVSPIDGKWVDGRSARREHMKVHDVVDVGDRPPRKYRNPEFIKKHHLKVD